MIQAENPFGAQAGSGRKRWLIEGAKEIALAAGSGQWRLTADGKRLQYAPAVKEEEEAAVFREDFEAAAPAGQACRAVREQNHMIIALIEKPLSSIYWVH
jgi:hypothetical protein